MRIARNPDRVGFLGVAAYRSTGPLERLDVFNGERYFLFFLPDVAVS
jgi:hypothetical protein